MADPDSYLRFPTVHGSTLAFVAEDDVWLAPLEGGRAWRLTAERAPVANTRFSPDGSLLAYTSRRDGAPEVHVVPVAGGAPRRLTFWGDAWTRVIGWTADGRVLAVSATGQPFRSRTWAYAVAPGGVEAEPAADESRAGGSGVPQRLDYGPVTQLAAGPGGALVLGVNQNRRGAASWKRYRGGMAGKLWLDPAGRGEFSPFLAEVDGQLEDPAWIGDRLVLLSDHEGYGNVYSCRPGQPGQAAAALIRHTDHGDFYARAASTDGRRVVYQCAGDLWLLDELTPTSEPRRLEVWLGGPRSGRAAHPVPAEEHLGDLCPDLDGRASAVEIRGTVHWLTTRDGPARVLAARPGVRARMPQVFATAHGRSVAWVSDAEGEDCIEVVAVDARDDGDGGGVDVVVSDREPRRLAAGQLGRALELAASPDGSTLAAASHDGRVLVVDVASGAVRTLDASADGDASGLCFSPDSRWLAWSHACPPPLRQIRMAGIDGSELVAATALRFCDSEPTFTLDGKHLAFLSARTFDPLYDAHVFDMSFAAGTRPYLLPLEADTPSPFDPAPGGRGWEPDAAGDGKPSTGGGTGAASTEKTAAPPCTVDVEGLLDRVVPVPVPAGRYSQLRAVRDALVWLADPMVGELGDALAHLGATPPRPALQRYDLRERRLTVLAEGVDDVESTGDGTRLVLRDAKTLRVVPSDRKVPPPGGDDDESGTAVEVDLSRVRLQVDPAAEWTQMYDEAGRLMRDHYWIEDMAGVDWDAVLDRYRPLLARIGSRDDLSELLWEVQGELGASHAYEIPPERPVDAARRVGLLGADLQPDDDGTWRVARVVPGESSAPAARSPLSAPGVAVRAGDAIVAVGGQPVDPLLGPAPLLVGRAETPVELTVVPQPDEGADSARWARTVVVVPLASEMPLRYQAWVTGRRAAVHAATDGRVGYLHVPDMMANGWAQLHRDLRLEVTREALVVDVRDNGGGHVSALVLEKLAKTVRGWSTSRHLRTAPYPEEAPRGPLVAVTNEQAGSDGDIVTAIFQTQGLGPVVGTRTWGGVIGIDGRYRLVDGTSVTQPRYSFWFEGPGWGVENYGVDPDVEVLFAPQDWATGADPQLDVAIGLALEALESRPAATPPDPTGRPTRAAPLLPPRS